MTAWRWLWAWFGEPERPPRRPRGAAPVGETSSEWREVASGRADRVPGRRSRRPLPRATRAELERALGADLAGLSLAIDPGFTAAFDARAVQIGSTVVLGDPADAQDLPLLAHEAAHFLQAQRRGVRPGIGAPGDAGEQAAVRATGALTAGDRSAPAPAGPPVAAIQRQAAAPGETRGAGKRDPEAIRAMLMLAYASQGGQGNFVWSDELAAAFRRLLPGVALARLQILWEPPPKNPAEALARLQAAGVVAAAAPPTLLEPAPLAEPAPGATEAGGEAAPQPAPGPPEIAEPLPQRAAEELPPEVPLPLPEPVEPEAPEKVAAERPLEETATPAAAQAAGKALDATIVVILPRPLPEAFARAGPILRRGFRLDGLQLRALRTDRSRARAIYAELLASASLDPNVLAGLAELLADLAWQPSVEATGAAPADDAPGPGSPWRSIGGALVARGRFTDLLAALTHRTEVTATLRFRP